MSLYKVEPRTHQLAARGKSQAALRADLSRQLCVAESAKYSSMTVVPCLDLTKNLLLPLAADFHTSLLDRDCRWVLRYESP